MPRRATLSLFALLAGCAASQATSDDGTDAGSADVGGIPEAGTVAEADGGPRTRNDGGDQLLVTGQTACTPVAIDTVRPACMSDNWCWMHPAPFGDLLNATIGFTDAQGNTVELWMVGALGVTLRVRGGVWEQVPTGVTAQLFAIWGSSPSDIWAVGEAGTILHYDGTAWSPSDAHDTVSFTSVWGSGRRDVWVAGGRGHVLHWDGASWSRSPNPLPTDLNGIWGVASTERVNETKALWAVGNDGAQVKWDGTKWSVMAPLTPYSLNAISGSSLANVWAGGVFGTAASFDGTTWTGSTTKQVFNLNAIATTGPNDVWAAGWSNTIAHYDGHAWTRDQVGQLAEVYRGAWACGPNSAWFVGTHGRVVQWTEDAAYTIRTGAFIEPGVQGGDITQVFDIGGSGPNDVYVATNKNLIHWDGTAWSVVPSTGEIRAIWASSPNSVYYATYVDSTVTGKKVMHWDGTSWQEDDPRLVFEMVSGSDVRFDGTGENDLWLFSPGKLFHKTNLWELVLEDSNLQGYAFWSPGADEAWILDSGLIRHYRNGAVSTAVMPERSLLWAIWGPKTATEPATFAWAVGEGGVIYRYDGTSWKLQPTVTTHTLRAIWGTGANDVWAAGDGAVLHYDGTTWTPSYTVSTNKLGSPMSGGIWGTSPNDTWMIGERGTILHRQIP